MMNNIFRNIQNNTQRCNHTSNKNWVSIKTIRVKRDGFGSAIKTVNERCRQCGEERVHDIPFEDTRINFGTKPFLHNSGDIYKNADRKDYKKDIKEYNHI